MSVRQFVAKYRGAFIQSRISPISRPALILVFVLVTLGIISSIATTFIITTLPNMLPLVGAVLVVDVVTQLAPQTRIVEGVRLFIYGVLFLVTISLCGVVAAYSMQRFAFPLQDRNLTNIDLALGFNWFDYARWIDGHAVVQDIFHFAYHSIMGQVFLPLIVFAVANRVSEMRTYLCAFAIAFVATIVISALMPAAGPIAFVDRASFHLLQFTGATPLDDLKHLRTAGPFIMTDFPGGIATFPSFHATIAVLIPLTLRRYRPVFVALLFLDAAMLGATISEGAHYFIDVVAGSGMAVCAYVLAAHIIRLEDRSFHRRSLSPEAAYSPAPAAG